MKIENQNLNIPNITVKDVVSFLSTLYTNAIKNRVSLKGIPTPFLWGAAGVGKSEGVYQIARRLEQETGKKAVVIDVRLLLYSPVDLLGFPVVSEHKEFCEYLKPKVFDMKPGDDYINILFLDELSAATQSVQAAAYQICLDRKVGEHKFPDNCIVIAAGNRTTDQSVSYRMPKALCNRLMHFNVQTNYEVWREWAVANGIDERIVGYLAFDNTKLCIEPKSSDTAYPTPRSWAFVSNLLKILPGSIDENVMLIGSCIGTETALEFSAWVKVYDQLPDVDSVLNGRCTVRPRTNDALHAFMASLVSAVVALGERISLDQLDNVCAYVNQFPVDFATCFYQDIKSVEGIRAKLTKSPARRSWVARHKDAI